jgi:hypothetical protein
MNILNDHVATWSVNFVDCVESSGPKHVNSRPKGEPYSDDCECSFSQRVAIWTVMVDEEVCLGEGFESHFYLAILLLYGKW